ncbi:MAG: sulfotransferase family protein [Planctomycetota bacterium]|nr:MAG: sulfotransferase family protein [Planctomycetota bacterium]
MNGETRPWVTVVSGLPRSGTSMIMQMLAAGGMEVLTDELREADEDNRRGYFEYEPVKRTRKDASWVGEALGRVVKVVDLLLRDLPAEFDYRVVLTERPLGEVLASQRVMLARRGEAGANLSDDALAAAFARQRAGLEQWLAEHPSFRVLKIHYHDVLSRPSEEVARLCEFLEGGLDQQAMVAAVEPRLRHQTS